MFYIFDITNYNFKSEEKLITKFIKIDNINDFLNNTVCNYTEFSINCNKLIDVNLNIKNIYCIKYGMEYNVFNYKALVVETDNESNEWYKIFNFAMNEYNSINV